MLRIWKESDRILWMLILLYAVVSIVFAMPSPAEATTNSRPATLLEMTWAAEGGLSEEDRQQARQKLTEHLRWMEANLPPQWGRYSLSERGEWVFQAMHDRLLTGEYQENQHALSVALRKGDFNCVSATILFQILADRAGLPTIAMQTRGHVWCRLLSRPQLDIETTCPTWFLLEPHDRDQAPAVQAGEDARGLSPRGLAAKIPYNKASLAAASGDYAAAMDLLNHALALDPQDPAALKNRGAILNNWAVACLSQSDCDQALDLLKRMEGQSPGDEDLEANRRRIVDSVIDQWCRAGRYSDALRIWQWQPNPSESRHSLKSLYTQWIEDAQARGEWFEAKNALRLAIAALEEDSLSVAQLRRQYQQLLSR